MPYSIPLVWYVCTLFYSVAAMLQMVAKFNIYNILATAEGYVARNKVYW